MAKEWHLIDTPLTTHGIYPDFASSPVITYDEWTRICSYICSHIDDIIQLPEGLEFEVRPIAWHRYGAARPTIIMVSDERFARTPIGSSISESEVHDAIAAYMRNLGIERLRELATGETLRWDTVIHDYIHSLGIEDFLEWVPGEFLLWQDIDRALEKKKQSRQS